MKHQSIKFVQLTEPKKFSEYDKETSDREWTKLLTNLHWIIAKLESRDQKK